MTKLTRACPTPDECSVVLELRALLEDACKVFERYDLPEHAFHYRRILNGKEAAVKAAITTN